MQQHISPEWLGELTTEEQDVLRQIWEPKVGDRFAHYWPNENDNLVLVESLILAYAKGKITDGGSIVWHKDASLPLLSIGQMIELLCRSDFGFPRIGLTEARDRAETIVVSVLCLNGSRYHGKSFEDKELARALWEAVKGVIKAKAREVCDG